MFLLTSFFTIPFALADVTGTFKNAWQGILSIGTLDFIGVSGIAPLTRILIWILCFTVFFATITILGKGGKAPLSFFNRSQAIVVAGIIATIAAVFLPVGVILAVGTGWATAVALVLIGGPVFGLGLLVISYPGKGQETKFTVLLKLILCLLLFWILSAMKTSAVLS